MAARRRRPPGSCPQSYRGLARATLPALLVVAAGCWDDPVRERVTVDLRERGRVGLAVAIELDSARELADEPGARRTVELAERELLDGRHRWNERFAALACAVESGGWRREAGELRRYTLEAICDDVGALNALLGDRQLVVELSWHGSSGELALVPNGGGGAGRAEHQRLEHDLDGFTRTFARYLAETRRFAALAEREPARAALLWHALLVEGESDGEGLTAAERRALDAELEAIGELLGAFTREAGASESLDSLARRVFDPLPRELDVVMLPGTEHEVEGFVSSAPDRYALPPRGLEGVLAGFAGRWLEPDPALVWLRHARSGSDEPPSIAPFLAGSIVRSDEAIDEAALRRDIDASLEPAAVYRVAWRRKGAAAREE
jgi:hypothetical protein